MNFKNLEKDIKDTKLSPVYLFTGEERYLINTYINKIKQTALNPATEDFNFLKYEDKKDDVFEILANAETAPLMSDKRMIIIDEEVDLLSLKNEDQIESFKNYLDNPTNTTVLIILSQKPDKRRVLYKRIKKAGKIIEFSKLTQAEVVKWVIKELKENHIKISRADASYLIDRLHYLENEKVDLVELKTQLTSLSDYVNEEGTLTREIIDEVVPESIEDNVFKMIDLIVQGKLAGVYSILDYFWEQGESPIGIFSLLLYQLRNILKVKMLLEEGKTQQEIIKQTGLRAFIVRKIIPVARFYSLSQLLSLFIEAGELDLNMKKGMIDPAFGLENYLLKLARKK